MITAVVVLKCKATGGEIVSCDGYRRGCEGASRARGAVSVNDYNLGWITAQAFDANVRFAHAHDLTVGAGLDADCASHDAESVDAFLDRLVIPRAVSGNGHTAGVRGHVGLQGRNSRVRKRGKPAVAVGDFSFLAGGGSGCLQVVTSGSEADAPK